MLTREDYYLLGFLGEKAPQLVGMLDLKGGFSAIGVTDQLRAMAQGAHDASMGDPPDPATWADDDEDED